DGRVDVGEHLEFARAAHVVAVARRAIADDAAAIGLLDLAGLVRLDHAVLFRHPPDPAVALDAHAVFPAAQRPDGLHCRRRLRPPEIPMPERTWAGAAPPRPATTSYSNEAEIGIAARGRFASSSSNRTAVSR